MVVLGEYVFFTSNFSSLLKSYYSKEIYFHFSKK
uniref:Uncharacterized protein n=1 Tax=Rhizophora mucronata TaxID=61149 RepID=A0A2P2PEX8_RHIMU